MNIRDNQNSQDWLNLINNYVLIMFLLDCLQYVLSLYLIKLKYGTSEVQKDVLGIAQ